MVYMCELAYIRMYMVLVAVELLLISQHVVGKKIPCEDITLTAPQGNVSSPDYPENYPNNLECSTDIVLTDNNAIIVLNFTVFEFEAADRGVCYDRLEVTDVGVPINGTTTYCTVGAFVYTSQTNHIRLTIYSDHAVEKRGYFAYYYASTIGTSPPPMNTSHTSDSGSSSGGRLVDNVPWYILFVAIVAAVIFVSIVGLAIFYSCPGKQKSEKIKLVKKYKSKDIDESIGKTEYPHPR